MCVAKARSRFRLGMKRGRQSAPSPGRPHINKTKHPHCWSDTWPDRHGDAAIQFQQGVDHWRVFFCFVFFPSAAPVSSTGRAQRASSLSVEGAAKYQRCHVDWVANERPGCRTGGQCPGRPSSLPCSRCTSRIVFSYCCIRATKSCQKKYTGASGLLVFELFKLVSVIFM